MNDRCTSCEDHAKLHSSNTLGTGTPNDRCEQCENHARMHAAESGCGAALVMLTACAALLLARKAR